MGAVRKLQRAEMRCCDPEHASGSPEAAWARSSGNHLLQAQASDSALDSVITGISPATLTPRPSPALNSHPSHKHSHSLRHTHSLGPQTQQTLCLDTANPFLSPS